MAVSKGANKSGQKKTQGSKRGDRSKRLLDLVMLLLRARAPVAFRTIRDQFTSYKTTNVEAGLRAFERDKADLLELGVPIRYVTPDEDDAIEDGGYVIDLKRYRLPEVSLTADEISSLVLAASVAAAVPGVSYARIVHLALKKLAFDFPDMDTPMEFPQPIGTNSEPVLVHFPDAPAKQSRMLSDRFSQLEAATRNRKWVTMAYRSASTGMVQTRDLDPYGLVYRQGTWVVIGYCHLRKDVRSFRIDRIETLKLAPKPKSPDFERPEDFDVRLYANRSPWTFETSTIEDVTLEIHPEAASTSNEDFGANAVRETLSDGTVLIHFPCGNPDYVVSRVLSAKGSISVRKGNGVLDLLRQELAAIRRHYK
jgi:proteasome accessory factor B